MHSSTLIPLQKKIVGQYRYFLNYLQTFQQDNNFFLNLEKLFFVLIYEQPKRKNEIIILHLMLINGSFFWKFSFENCNHFAFERCIVTR